MCARPRLRGTRICRRPRPGRALAPTSLSAQTSLSRWPTARGRRVGHKLRRLCYVGGEECGDDVERRAALLRLQPRPTVHEVGGECIDVPPSVALVQPTQDHRSFVDGEVGDPSTDVVIKLGIRAVEVRRVGWRGAMLKQHRSPFSVLSCCGEADSRASAP